MKSNHQICEVIRQKLQFLRKQKNWSLEKTARKIAVPSSTYRDWEKTGKISAENLVKVAQVYHVSLSFFSAKPDTGSENVKKAIYYLEAALDSLSSL